MIDLYSSAHSQLPAIKKSDEALINSSTVRMHSVMSNSGKQISASRKKYPQSSLTAADRAISERSDDKSLRSQCAHLMDSNKNLILPVTHNIIENCIFNGINLHPGLRPIHHSPKSSAASSVTNGPNPNNFEDLCSHNESLNSLVCGPLPTVRPELDITPRPENDLSVVRHLSEECFVKVEEKISQKASLNELALVSNQSNPPFPVSQTNRHQISEQFIHFQRNHNNNIAPYSIQERDESDILSLSPSPRHSHAKFCSESGEDIVGGTIGRTKNYGMKRVGGDSVNTVINNMTSSNDIGRSSTKLEHGDNFSQLRNGDIDSIIRSKAVGDASIFQWCSMESDGSIINNQKQDSQYLYNTFHQEALGSEEDEGESSVDPTDFYFQTDDASINKKLALIHPTPLDPPVSPPRILCVASKPVAQQTCSQFADTLFVTPSAPSMIPCFTALTSNPSFTGFQEAILQRNNSVSHLGSLYTEKAVHNQNGSNRPPSVHSVTVKDCGVPQMAASGSMSSSTKSHSSAFFNTGDSLFANKVAKNGPFLAVSLQPSSTVNSVSAGDNYNHNYESVKEIIQNKRAGVPPSASISSQSFTSATNNHSSNNIIKNSSSQATYYQKQQYNSTRMNKLNDNNHLSCSDLNTGEVPVSSKKNNSNNAAVSMTMFASVDLTRNPPTLPVSFSSSTRDECKTVHSNSILHDSSDEKNTANRHAASISRNISYDNMYDCGDLDSCDAIAAARCIPSSMSSHVTSQSMMMHVPPFRPSTRPSNLLSDPSEIPIVAHVENNKSIFIDKDKVDNNISSLETENYLNKNNQGDVEFNVNNYSQSRNKYHLYHHASTVQEQFSNDATSPLIAPRIISSFHNFPDQSLTVSNDDSNKNIASANNYLPSSHEVLFPHEKNLKVHQTPEESPAFLLTPHVSSLASPHALLPATCHSVISPSLSTQRPVVLSPPGQVQAMHKKLNPAPCIHPSPPSCNNKDNIAVSSSRRSRSSPIIASSEISDPLTKKHYTLSPPLPPPSRHSSSTRRRRSNSPSLAKHQNVGEASSNSKQTKVYPKNASQNSSSSAKKKTVAPESHVPSRRVSGVSVSPVPSSINARRLSLPNDLKYGRISTKPPANNNHVALLVRDQQKGFVSIISPNRLQQQQQQQQQLKSEAQRNPQVNATLELESQIMKIRDTQLRTCRLLEKKRVELVTAQQKLLEAETEKTKLQLNSSIANDLRQEFQCAIGEIQQELLRVKSENKMLKEMLHDVATAQSSLSAHSQIMPSNSQTSALNALSSSYQNHEQQQTSAVSNNPNNNNAVLAMAALHSSPLPFRPSSKRSPAASSYPQTAPRTLPNNNSAAVVAEWNLRSNGGHARHNNVTCQQLLPASVVAANSLGVSSTSLLPINRENEYLEKTANSQDIMQQSVVPYYTKQDHHPAPASPSLFMKTLQLATPLRVFSNSDDDDDDDNMNFDYTSQIQTPQQYNSHNHYQQHKTEVFAMSPSAPPPPSDVRRRQLGRTHHHALHEPFSPTAFYNQNASGGAHLNKSNRSQHASIKVDNRISKFTGLPSNIVQRLAPIDASLTPRQVNVFSQHIQRERRRMIMQQQEVLAGCPNSSSSRPLSSASSANNYVPTHHQNYQQQYQGQHHHAGVDYLPSPSLPPSYEESAVASNAMLGARLRPSDISNDGKKQQVLPPPALNISFGVDHHHNLDLVKGNHSNHSNHANDSHMAYSSAAQSSRLTTSRAGDLKQLLKSRISSLQQKQNIQHFN